MSPLEAHGGLEALSAGLGEVEALLRTTVASEHPLLADAAGFLVDAGGKRFRPAVVLGAGLLGDHDAPGLVPCAAAIELMHLATLYHDDVMDETAMRRGVPTAHRRYGNARAILVGDYLFARASGLAAELGTYVARRLADTIAALVDGQILETELSADPGADLDVALRVPTVAEHLEVLRLKTGALIASSAHLGAHLAGCEPAIVEAATIYGEATGLAFQLADDLLDITSEPGQSGKEPGTDLREGVLTLPAIVTLAGEVDGTDELRRHLREEAWEPALRLLRTNGSVEAARLHLDRERVRARAALDALPEGPGRAMLAELAGLAAERSS